MNFLNVPFQILVSPFFFFFLISICVLYLCVKKKKQEKISSFGNFSLNYFMDTYIYICIVYEYRKKIVKDCIESRKQVA